MRINLENGVAVKVYDVVAFFNAQVKKGKPTISHNHEGATYYFSSEQNKEQFKSNPIMYVPQYGGYCATAMSEGKEVDPTPQSYRIQDDKLYLFTRMYWGIIDAQRQWNKTVSYTHLTLPTILLV